jgi:hypothetical protein
VVAAMMGEGMFEAEARKRCWLVDSRGLVVRSRTELGEHNRPYAHEHPHVPAFLSAIKAIEPTAIIGVVTVGKSFTRAALEEMARLNERPIVFALSNPTSHLPGRRLGLDRARRAPRERRDVLAAARTCARADPIEDVRAHIPRRRSRVRASADAMCQAESLLSSGLKA